MKVKEFIRSQALKAIAETPIDSAFIAMDVDETEIARLKGPCEILVLSCGGFHVESMEGGN